MPVSSDDPIFVLAAQQAASLLHRVQTEGTKITGNSFEELRRQAGNRLIVVVQNDFTQAAPLSVPADYDEVVAMPVSFYAVPRQSGEPL